MTLLNSRASDFSGVLITFSFHPLLWWRSTATTNNGRINTSTLTANSGPNRLKSFRVSLWEKEKGDGWIRRQSPPYKSLYQRKNFRNSFSKINGKARRYLRRAPCKWKSKGRRDQQHRLKRKITGVWDLTRHIFCHRFPKGKEKRSYAPIYCVLRSASSCACVFAVRVRSRLSKICLSAPFAIYCVALGINSIWQELARIHRHTSDSVRKRWKEHWNIEKYSRAYRWVFTLVGKFYSRRCTECGPLAKQTSSAYIAMRGLLYWWEMAEIKFNNERRTAKGIKRKFFTKCWRRCHCLGDDAICSSDRQYWDDFFIHASLAMAH